VSPFRGGRESTLSQTSYIFIYFLQQGVVPQKRTMLSSRDPKPVTIHSHRHLPGQFISLSRLPIPVVRFFGTSDQLATESSGIRPSCARRSSASRYDWSRGDDWRRSTKRSVTLVSKGHLDQSRQRTPRHEPVSRKIHWSRELPGLDADFLG
jgi:hypothetical protein